MKSSRLFFILTISFLGFSASYAQEYLRPVQFEWEQVDGAKTYEIELVRIVKSPVDQNIDGPAQNFKTKDAFWSGMLAPAVYKMRLRTRDYRGVPGQWSPVSEFPVDLEKISVTGPHMNSEIQTDQAENSKVKFQWVPVGGAAEYEFELTSADGKTKISETTKESNFETTLPVAQKYKWKVRAKNIEGISSPEQDAQEFSILGQKIDSPNISKQENSYVREIQWEQPKYGQEFDITLLKMDPKSKKFQPFKEWKSSRITSLPFESDWPGGIYQINVRSTAEGRAHSNWSRNTFKVENGDRSPATEYVATVRKSIDRITGWYAIASYLITEMTYRNTNADRNTYLNLNAIGGTARLGLGWFHPSSSWGFLGSTDISGFTIQGKTHNYAAAEVNAIYRYSVGDRTELRIQGGGFYKEFPELVASTQIGNYDGNNTVAAGPHLGAELWYSLTPKVGLQLHAHSYISMFGIETPNGQDINESHSFHVGIMGSYRFNKSFTGLLGFTMREEVSSYGTKSNTSANYNNNESKISGNYLNFYAEWAF